MSKHLPVVRPPDEKSHPLPSARALGGKGTRVAGRGHALAVAGMVAAVAGSACERTPRDRHVQWVARDAWSSSCADKAIVERWVQQNGQWKVQGEVWRVDVDATFKLGDDCDAGPDGQALPAYQSVDFRKQGLELSRCHAGGEEGWSLVGQESERCWTGPKLAK